MAWKRLVFRTVGGLVVLTWGWSAAAEQAWNRPHVGDMIEPPSPTSSKSQWRPAGSARRSAPALLPVPTSASPVPRATASTEPERKEPELAVERYANGRPKIERHGTKDADGNFINHGTYTMYDPDGRIRRTGEFRNGQQHGKWIHLFDRDDGHLFSAKGDNQFTGPFVSEASFEAGKLHGVWSIKAHGGQKVVEWGFEHGNRHGKSAWWYANGENRLEATYKNGILHGDVLEWGRDGALAKRGTYVDGRYLAKTVQWHAPGKRHYEGYYLKACRSLEPTFDWWTGTATVAPALDAGPDEKHGLWTSWYLNGNKQAEGRYDHGLPAGKFIWWYENGQKQAEGEYSAGVKCGTWVTWHPNGMKESKTDFRAGVLIGKWTQWNPEGRLVEEGDLSAAGDSGAEKQPTITGQKPARDVQIR